MVNTADMMKEIIDAEETSWKLPPIDHSESASLVKKSKKRIVVRKKERKCSTC